MTVSYQEISKKGYIIWKFQVKGGGGGGPQTPTFLKESMNQNWNLGVGGG